MKPENKILACVDQSHYADHVADYAAWVATRMGLPLEFLHILDRHPERSRHNQDHSGAIGFDAQKVLSIHVITSGEPGKGLQPK